MKTLIIKSSLRLYSLQYSFNYILVVLEYADILPMQFVWDICTSLDHLNSPSAQTMNWVTQLSHCVLNTYSPKVSQGRVTCVYVFLRIISNVLYSVRGVKADYLHERGPERTFKDCPLG